MTSLALARTRARARHAAGGAALFVVAVTLGLLAAMSVYGLNATSTDIRAAGHLREAAQGQAAAEHALMLTAETFTPSTTGELVRAMQSTGIQSTACRSANAYDSTTNAEFRAAQACVTLNTKQMYAISKNVNAWTAGNETSTFTSESFGKVPRFAEVRVEVTNPVEMPPPPGTSLNDRYVFSQLTVTTFVDVKSSATSTTESSVQGRGRITVGPYFR